MPVYRHPRALEAVPGHPPAQVSLARDHHAVEGGTFATDDAAAVRALADAYGVAVADLRVSDDSDSADAGGVESASSTDGETDTCEVVKSDGDVCGRERPCPYHDKRD